MAGRHPGGNENPDHQLDNFIFQDPQFANEKDIPNIMAGGHPEANENPDKQFKELYPSGSSLDWPKILRQSDLECRMQKNTLLLDFLHFLNHLTIVLSTKAPVVVTVIGLSGLLLLDKTDDYIS
eukprot:gene11035-3319_t